MRGKRSKWIRKVVVSRHPIIVDMLQEKYGKETANKMTYKQVIRACKKMWNERTPGVEQWCIFEEGGN